MFNFYNEAAWKQVYAASNCGTEFPRRSTLQIDSVQHALTTQQSRTVVSSASTQLSSAQPAGLISLPLHHLIFALVWHAGEAQPAHGAELQPGGRGVQGAAAQVPQPGELHHH